MKKVFYAIPALAILAACSSPTPPPKPERWITVGVAPLDKVRYTVTFTVRDGAGKLVEQAKTDTTPGERFTIKSSHCRPYIKEIVEGKAIQNTLCTGAFTSGRLSVLGDGKLEVEFEPLNYTELMNMRQMTTGGVTIDLPEVYDSSDGRFILLTGNAGGEKSVGGGTVP